ncbi:MAG TPA: protein-export chaperone SecB [Alphaproteobacteria bacterium]|nr:protein-export chaperone SecB [Alphaproteobacteria bacterium]
MTQDNLNDQKMNNENPQFAVVTQFLKDLSFECPKANVGIDEKDLELDIAVGLATKAVSEDVFEVSLKLTADAKLQEKTVFLADVSYAGQFIMKNIPEEQKEMLIGIEAPQLLFPFARRILMNVITDAGFRSPQIEPINFAHLFMQARTQKSEAPAEKKKIEQQ